jgi:hypothetical protein
MQFAEVAMTLKLIKLELARDPDFPEGSRNRGYKLVVPLDESDHLAAQEWHAHRDRCRVRRFWAGEERKGRLVRRPGGSWAIDYDPRTHEDDEPGFRLDKHRFVPGEYVSFKENDGVMRTFRVAAIEDVA